MIKTYKHINLSIMGMPSASIPQNQREAPLPVGLTRWRSGIAVRHVTEGSWVRFPLKTSFFPKKFFRYYKPSFVYIYIYIYIYNRIEQCALLVTTIMALWRLVNLGTRCTVTHCRIASWSHQSAQTASSERCIMQIVNVSLRDSPPNL